MFLGFGPFVFLREASCWEVLPVGPGSPASSLGLKPSRPGGVFPRAALPLRAGPGVSRLDDGASLGSLGAGGEGRQSPG